MKNFTRYENSEFDLKISWGVEGFDPEGTLVFAAYGLQENEIAKNCEKAKDAFRIDKIVVLQISSIQKGKFDDENLVLSRNQKYHYEK